MKNTITKPFGKNDKLGKVLENFSQQMDSLPTTNFGEFSKTLAEFGARVDALTTPKEKRIAFLQKTADAYVALKKQIAPLEKEMNRLGVILKTQNDGEGEYIQEWKNMYPDHYLLRIRNEMRESVPQPVIRAVMGMTWFDTHSVKKCVKVLTLTHETLDYSEEKR